MVETKTKVDDGVELSERLGAARAEAEEWLDNRAEQLRAEFPSIPVGWHRQQLTALSLGIGCPCMAVIREVEKNK